MFNFGRSLFQKHRVAKVVAFTAATTLIGAVGLQFANAADTTTTGSSNSCAQANRTSTADGTNRTVFNCQVVVVLQPLIQTTLEPSATEAPTQNTTNGSSISLVPGANTYGTLSVGTHRFTCQSQFQWLKNPGLSSYQNQSSSTGDGNWWVKTLDSPSYSTRSGSGQSWYWFPASAIAGGTDGSALPGVFDCTTHSIPSSTSSDNSSTTNNSDTTNSGTSNSDTSNSGSSNSDTSNSDTSNSSYSNTDSGDSGYDTNASNVSNNVSDVTDNGDASSSDSSINDNSHVTGASSCNATNSQVIGDNGTGRTTYPSGYNCYVFRSGAPAMTQPNSSAHQIGTLNTGTHTFVCQVQGQANPTTTNTNGTTNSNTWWLAGRANNISDNSSNGWGFVPETFIQQGEQGAGGALPGIPWCSSFQEVRYR